MAMASEAPVIALDNKEEQDIASASSVPPDATLSLRDESKIPCASGQEIMGDSVAVKDYNYSGISSDGGGGGGCSDAPEHDNVAHDDDDDDDDDHALAQMMALQEEQQDDDGITDRATNVNVDDNDAANNPPVRPFNNLILAIQQYDAEQAARNNNNNNDDNGFEGEDEDHPMNNIPPLPHNQQRHSILHTLFSIFRPSLRYIPLSFLSAFLLIHHTLRTRQQFYLAMTYLSTSKLSYIILGNAIIAFYVKVFTLVTQLFLEGGLRPNERDSIGEQMRWDVTETCLALTMFRSELDVGTAIKFLTLVVMKGLHWSVELRGSHLRMTEEVFAYPDEEGGGVHDDDPDHIASIIHHRSKQAWYHRLPSVRVAHIRYYTLVQILLSLDILAVSQCALSVVAAKGRSVDILFGFEATILLVSGLSSLGLYNLHVIDGIMGVFQHLAEGEHHYVPVGGMAEPSAGHEDDDGRRPLPQDQHPAEQGGDEADGDRSAAAATTDLPPARRNKSFAKIMVEYCSIPWRDRRATLALAIELQAQAAKFLFYSIFFAVVLTNYGMPINIFREVYVSFQQLRRRLVAFNNYRRLTHNMDSRFESIKDQEELDNLGHTCIICRDHMDLLGGCKKLPGCGHAFHTHCLREWLVQQQTCPTCRSDIVANEARRKKKLEEEAAAAAIAANAPAERGMVDGIDSTSATPVAVNDSGAESRTVSRPTAIETSTSPSIKSPRLELASPRFPCLYRITLPSGAPVFSSIDSSEHRHIAAIPDQTKRVIPRGKLVVSTSIEYWPSPFQEPMLCIPDGYVRLRDVERYLILSSQAS